MKAGLPLVSPLLLFPIGIIGTAVWKNKEVLSCLSHVVYLSDLVILWNYLMKGGSFMANTEIFLRNIFGTTRPNIRPLVLALNITNDLLFEQHISMSDIKATKHIYPDVARLLHKKPETVYKSVIRLAHRCWDALVEQDLVLSYLGRSMKQEPDPSVFITYLAVYIQSDIPFFEFIERDPGFLFRDSPDIFGMSDIPPESTTKLLLRNKPLLVSQAMAFTSPAGLTTFPVCPACMATLEREGQNFCDHCGQRLDWRWYKHAQIIYPGQKSALNILDKDDVLIST